MKTGLLASLVLSLALGLPAATAQTAAGKPAPGKPTPASPGKPAAAASAAAGKTDSVTALALKRVADRYALTKSRISALLDERRNPTPLPATLANPFYRPPDLPSGVETSGGPGEGTVVPPVPDETDEGTLARFAASLRISGLTVLNGVPLLTLNGTLCKAGDTIPLESKGRTAYIQVITITPDELTLGLNAERQVVRVKR